MVTIPIMIARSVKTIQESLNITTSITIHFIVRVNIACHCRSIGSCADRANKGNKQFLLNSCWPGSSCTNRRFGSPAPAPSPNTLRKVSLTSSSKHTITQSGHNHSSTQSVIQSVCVALPVSDVESVRLCMTLSIAFLCSCPTILTKLSIEGDVCACLRKFSSNSDIVTLSLTSSQTIPQ